MRIYNYLSRNVEIVRPLKEGRVGLYACGPTVYNYVHIGNLRAYIFEDILRRALELSGLRVTHIMNITDVGHLTSDADTGEDKLAQAAKRERKTAWDVARFYEEAFKRDLKKLNIVKPNQWTRATEHIKEQIALIRTLEKKGYTYEVPGDGVYFDTSKLKDYGKLTPSRLEGIKAGARVEVVKGKHNATDFALWKLSPAGSARDMEWKSPWGVGFPGWHIECSAMSMKYLGPSFDMHAGGVDHIPIHHTNEIAQSEAATGKPFVKYFVEGEFLLVDGHKMSKSLGNFYTLSDIEAKGFDPLDFRFLILQAHYRSILNFTWQALEAASDGRKTLIAFQERLKDYRAARIEAGKVNWARMAEQFKKKFKEMIQSDLDTPGALALVFEFIRMINPMLETRIIPQEGKKAFEAALAFVNSVLAVLPPKKAKSAPLPEEIKTLLEKREKLREAKKFTEADAIRNKIQELGYTMEDTAGKTRVKSAE